MAIRAGNPRDSRRQLLLQILEEAYWKKTWHGPNLRQSLRGVSTRDAVWRPAAGRHNIWEEALHAAYWKYAVRRRLLGEKRGSFALKGSNWFRSPESASEGAWRRDRELLETEHHNLLEAVAGLGDEKSLRKFTPMIYGVAFHDIYHAGQIRLLRRLQERARTQSAPLAEN
jgi:hypothetical protein